jgi:hypothetical protein
MCDRHVHDHAIHALDLEPIKLRVMDPELGKGWTREHAENIECAYKAYLAMLKLVDQAVKGSPAAGGPQRSMAEFTYGASGAPLPVDPAYGYSSFLVNVYGDPGVGTGDAFTSGISSTSTFSAGSRGLAVGLFAKGEATGWSSAGMFEPGVIVSGPRAGLPGGNTFALEANCNQSVTAGGKMTHRGGRLGTSTVIIRDRDQCQRYWCDHWNRHPRGGATQAGRGDLRAEHRGRGYFSLHHFCRYRRGDTDDPAGGNGWQPVAGRRVYHSERSDRRT